MLALSTVVMIQSLQHGIITLKPENFLRREERIDGRGKEGETNMKRLVY
jgi:hypothetical protein